MESVEVRTFVPFRFKRATDGCLKSVLISIFLLSFSSNSSANSNQSDLISDLSQEVDRSEWRIKVSDPNEAQAELNSNQHLEFSGTYYLNIPTHIVLEIRREVYGFIGIEVEWVGDGHSYAIYLDEKPSVECDCGSQQVFGVLVPTERNKRQKEYLKFASFDLVEPRVDVENRPIGDSIIDRITISARDDLFHLDGVEQPEHEKFSLELISIRLVK